MVCTVSRPTLETFLDWLEGRGVQVICCGDQEQPPPISGEMPHDWLNAVAQQPANYYEEVEVDHRAKDPLRKALKKRIRLQPNKVRCQEIRKVLPGCLGWERFVEAWKPCDLIMNSILKVRDRAQKLLFEEYFPETSVPLLYRLEDTRRQNIMVTIPGPSPEGSPNQQELVLNDVVEVPLKYAREVLGGMWGSDWALGYAITVHSSQGLTIADQQKVWIIDDCLQWSNLAYLAVSRVEHLSQLERVICPPAGRPTIWITVGQGPTALAVGAGGGCLDIFTLIYPFSPLSPSLWETARYGLKYCLKGPLNQKQPTNQQLSPRGGF